MSPAESNSVVGISNQMAKSNRVQIVKSPTEIAAAIKRIKTPDLSLDIPCSELFYNHRTDGKEDIYFLINLSDRTIEREIAFHVMGNIEEWNPLTGEIAPGKVNSKNNKTSITTTLKPLESTIYVFEKDK
jgi:hypothetical protein